MYVVSHQAPSPDGPMNPRSTRERIEAGDVSPDLVDSLAIAAAQSHARIEVDERRKCPTARTLRTFLRRGVPLLLSTGSHGREAIGRYGYCAGVVRELREL